MFGRVISFVICSFGIIFPFRLRILYSEILGWIFQFLYGSYYGLLNYILKELKEGERADLLKDKHDK